MADRILRPQRLGSLTSLRFFAALLVVIYHVTQYVPAMSYGFRATAVGSVGVTFFFVLSGFVLTWAHRPGGRLGVFYWRRLVRLWPLYALAAGMALAVTAARHQPLPDWGHITAVLLMVQSWAPNQEWHYAVNVPAWSLSAEVFFYAMFPLLVRLALTRRGRGPLAAASYLLVLTPALLGFVHLGSQYNLTSLYVAPYIRIGEFLAGMLLAGAMRQGWRPPLGLGSAALVMLVSYAVVDTVDVTGSADRAALQPALLTAVLLLPIMGLIAATAASDLEPGRRALAHPVLMRLGDWSYAVYLLHFPFVMWLVGASAGWGSAVTTVVSIGLVVGVIALGGLAFTFIERPIEARLRPLVGGRRVVPVPAATATTATTATAPVPVGIEEPASA